MLGIRRREVARETLRKKMKMKKLIRILTIKITNKNMHLELLGLIRSRRIKVEKTRKMKHRMPINKKVRRMEQLRVRPRLNRKRRKSIKRDQLLRIISTYNKYMASTEGKDRRRLHLRQREILQIKWVAVCLKRIEVREGTGHSLRQFRERSLGRLRNINKHNSPSKTVSHRFLWEKSSHWRWKIWKLMIRTGCRRILCCMWLLVHWAIKEASRQLSFSCRNSECRRSQVVMYASTTQFLNKNCI